MSAAHDYANRPVFGKRNTPTDTSIDQLRARMARCDRATVSGAALYRCMETMLREKLDAIAEAELAARPKSRRFFIPRRAAR